MDQDCSSVVPFRENEVLLDQQAFQDLMVLKGKRSVDISKTECVLLDKIIMHTRKKNLQK